MRAAGTQPLTSISLLKPATWQVFDRLCSGLRALGVGQVAFLGRAAFLGAPPVALQGLPKEGATSCDALSGRTALGHHSLRCTDIM